MLYLWSWSTQLVRVHPVVAAHEAAICKIEQLVDLALDL